MTEEEFSILIKVKSASVELYSNLSDNSYGGIIQLSDNNELRYDISKQETKIGIKVANLIRLMLDIDTSNKDFKLAKLYNFYDHSSEDERDKNLGLTTSSVMYVDKDYTAIIGKKGDFFFPSKENRNLEIYDNKTGNYVGSKVCEQATKYLLSYMTNWYPFQSINNFKNIKHLKDQNNDNYFLNNLNNAFSNEKVNK